MKRLLPILVIFLAGFPCFAKERDFSGAYNRPVVPDPEVVEIIAPVFAQLSGHASGDIYVPSNYKIIFGDVTSTDVAVHKTSANTITVEGNLTCTGATCGTTTAGGASYGTGGGTAQAQTVTPTPAVTSLTTGLNVCWLPIANNTAAAPTLAVAGLTAKPITKNGTVPLIKDDITTLGIACVIYDGTQFQLQVPLAGGVFSSSISTGTGPSAAGPTATGGIAFAEAASTGWTPTANQDYMRADSTAHELLCSWNGAPEVLCGGASFPVTVTSGVSGGIPYFSSSTVESASPILNTNVVMKGGGAGNPPTNSSMTDDGTSVTSSDSGGFIAPIFTSSGTTAGFIDFPQGTDSGAVVPCNFPNSICWEAPSSVTSYKGILPGAAATGIPHYANSANVITETISAINLAGADVTGQLPIANVGSAGLSGTAPIAISAAGAISCAACGSAAFPVTVSGTVTSGGIPYFSGTTTETSSGLLTQFGVLFGGGAGGSPTTSAQGAANMPLIGQGASNPIFSTIAYPTSLTSGGFIYASSTAALASSALLATNTIPKSGGAGTAPLASSMVDDGTSVTSTDTGGFIAPVFVSNGSTAGFVDYPQGSDSGSVAPCNTATSICEEAPTAVTAYKLVKPGVSATGIYTNNVSSAVITQGISGDANHSATVTIGSGTSIGSTTLCSSTNCPAGTYVVHVYVDITTACGTSGTYIVNLIYTDDQGSKTAVVNLNGTGSVPATGTLTTTSTANFGENSQVLRLTSGNLNYSTTAVACGTAGPMVGKLYMAAVPVM